MNSSAMRTLVSLFDCYIVVTTGGFALSARLKLNNTGLKDSIMRTGLLGFICYILVTMCGFSQTNCVTPPSGMVGWWPLDETSGTTVADISGSGLNGTASPGPIGPINSLNGPTPAILWYPVMAAGGPEVGGALYFWHQFDNRYIDVPSYSAITFATSDFSIDAWVFITQYNPGGPEIQPIAEKMQYSGTTPVQGYRFYLTSGGVLTFQVAVAGAITTTAVPMADQLTQGVWHHVAVTYHTSGGSQSIVLYIDGVNDGGAGLPSVGNFGNSNNDLIIGGSILGPAISYLDIAIDELEMFNVALAQQDIQSIFNARHAGKCKPACYTGITVTCPTNKTVVRGSAWTFDLPTGSSCCGSNVTIAVAGTVTNGVGQITFTGGGSTANGEVDFAGNTATGGYLDITAGTNVGIYFLSPGSGSNVLFTWDSMIFPTSNPFLDVSGLLFTNSNVQINLWGNGPGSYSLYGAPPAYNPLVTNGLATITVDPQMITQTWLLTDACGNSNTCSQTVTVIGNCIPPPANMVLWLPFDETSGSASANLASPANYGTQVGGPTVVLGAYVDNSLSFNGSDQYVTVPDYSAIDIGTNDLTIDAWVNRPTNSGTSVQTIIDKRSQSGGNYYGYSFAVSYNNLIFQLADGPYINYRDTGIVPADGLWHFVAVTVHRTSPTGGQFYVDGIPTAAFNPTAYEGSLANTSPLEVGNSSVSASYWFGGIDEVEVFNRALATSEIQSIFDAQTAGKCKPACYTGITVTCPTNKTVVSGSAWTFDLPTGSSCCGSNVTIAVAGTVTNGVGQITFAGGGSTANGEIDFAGNTATSGYLDITAGTNVGTYLLSPGSGSNAFFSWDGMIFLASDPFLDSSGLLFTGSGLEINLFGNGPGSYSLGGAPPAYEPDVTNGLATITVGPQMITQTWLLTDACGNSNTCSQTVTVIASGYLTLICPTNKSISCGSAWSFDTPNITDSACGISNVTLTFVTATNGGCPQSLSRTWFATDTCGNQAACSQTLTAINPAPPIITCASTKSGCGGAGNFDTPNAVDACSGVILPVTVLSTVTNSLNPLTMTRIWMTQDACGNTSTCSQTLTVPALLLSYTVSSNMLSLFWDDECCVLLEESDQPTGPWQTVPYAFNSYTVPLNGPATFYRLHGGSFTQNPGFSDGNFPGSMPSPGTVNNWFAAYGNPQVFNAPGCVDNGYIQLSGNQLSGDAIGQILVPAKHIIAGHNYQVSFCARYVPGGLSVNYPQVRAFAFNGSLPAGPNHPPPSTDLAIIDVSAPLNFTDWTTVILSCWTANKDFTSFAIDAQNETNASSTVDIDNVCLLEVLGTCPCNEAMVDANGNVIPPDNLDPNTPPTYDDVDQDNGYVSDLYGQFYDTSTALWYPTNDPCVSIGGTVPSSATNVDLDQIFLTNGLTITPEQLTNYLAIGSSNNLNWATNELATYQTDTVFWASATVTPPYTNSSSPTIATNLPSVFCGQDIVFVHGYRFDIIEDAALHKSTAMFNVWPDNKDEFYNNYQGNGHYGYWKQLADLYWTNHIEHYLTSRGNKNRYITIAHAVTQGMQIGASAMLTQISDAMNTGQGVVFDPSDRRGNTGFGSHGFVIVSHSDGALQTDIAMSIADQSRNHGFFQSVYGDAGYIADHCTAHVALHGGFSGSGFASLLYLLTTASTILTPIEEVIAFIDNTFTGADWNSATAAILGGETRDMTPEVAQWFWGPLCVSQMPVKTITIAGGHPSFYGVDWPTKPPPLGVPADIVKLLLLVGFDDGVLNMDSQTANFNLTILGPSTYIPIPYPFAANVFDMGIASTDPLRAIGYYLDQTFLIDLPTLYNGPLGVAAGSISALSPSGMVQPVWFNNPVQNAYHRYYNHYSFLMSASDHFWAPLGHSKYSTGKEPPDGNGSGPWYAPPAPNYEPTVYLGYFSSPPYNIDYALNDNSEECFVVTSPEIYQPIQNQYVNTTCPLVNPAIANLVKERVKGYKVGWTFKFFGRRYSWYFWIWKRHYHNLQGFETMDENDYMYKYVLQ
jgi:hypothetical protein